MGSLRHAWGMQWVGMNQPMEIRKKSCVGAASGQWELAVVCGLPEVEQYLMSRILEKQREFPLAIILFPLTPRVCELSSSPLINTSRSSRIKIYSYIFIYMCSSCSYNTTKGIHVPKAMINRDRWQERVKGIHVVSTPWW